MEKLRKEVKLNSRKVILASLILSVILNWIVSWPAKYMMVKLLLVISVLYFYMQFIYQFDASLERPRFEKNMFKVLFFNLFLTILSSFIIYMFAFLTNKTKVLPIVIFLLFTIISFLMHSFSFYTLKTKTNNGLFQGLIVLWKNKTKLFYLFIDSFIIALKFTMLAFVANVFVYSRTIPSILELSDTESATQLINLFKTPLSRFIQNTTITTGMFYIFYVSAYYVFKWIECETIKNPQNN